VQEKREKNGKEKTREKTFPTSLSLCNKEILNECHNDFLKFLKIMTLPSSKGFGLQINMFFSF